jgi:hypothetical protein
MRSLQLDTRSHMLAEEFKAEKLLAFIRLGIIASVAAVHLLIVRVVDLHVLYRRFRRLYKPWYRYVMATLDIAMVGGIAYGILEYKAIMSRAIPLGLLAGFALLLVFVSTVRFDPVNSLYLGLAYAALAGVVVIEAGYRFLAFPVLGDTVKGREEPVDVFEVVPVVPGNVGTADDGGNTGTTGTGT